MNSVASRYQRHHVLQGFGEKKQTKLSQAKVSIIGVGGLGSAVSLYLTAAGIGHLSLIDSDRVDVSNLQRQILYTEADLGHPKPNAAKAALCARNHALQCHAVLERLTPQNVDQYLRHADLVIDCTDNFETRFCLNDYCRTTQKPLIIGACTGYVGQVMSLDFRLFGSPCYECLYERCPQIADRPPADIGVLSPLPGLIGTLQVTEAIGLLTADECMMDQAKTPLTAKLWRIDLQTMQSHVTRLTQDPECACALSD